MLLPLHLNMLLPLAPSPPFGKQMPYSLLASDTATFTVSLDASGALSYVLIGTVAWGHS